MKSHDRVKIKLLIALLSVSITLIVIFLFFIDKSLSWNAYKIVSCIIVSLWIFFLIPAIRNAYLINKGNSLEEWFRMGFNFGASGIIFPILFAPYYGVKYYLSI